MKFTKQEFRNEKGELIAITYYPVSQLLKNNDHEKVKSKITQAVQNDHDLKGYNLYFDFEDGMTKGIAINLLKANSKEEVIVL